MESSRKLMRFHIFNCDNTYKLDPVEALLLKMEDKQRLNILVEKRYFRLHQMSEMCQTTIPKLQMDFAIFVVQAHESRLSINEDNAGIGYARIYRALLQATGGKVLIVIGGDDGYRDEDEEEQFVISRWARRKVASQFNEEYLDGKKSFIFSWNKKHREIHEEALLHYFDPSKKGQKFEHQPKPKPVPRIEQPKIAPPATIDIHEEFRGMDDREPLLSKDGNSTRLPRSSSDKQGPKTIRLDSSSAPAHYPEGTVLLGTRMRCGKISYDEEDIENWDRSWQPSEMTVRDLERDWKSIRLSFVEFVANGAGGVYCKVFEVKPRKKGPVVACISWCLSCTKACVVGTFYCILGMLIWFREWLRG